MAYGLKACSCHPLITYLRAKRNMNEGTSDIIAERKVQALFKNKQKSTYDNRM